MSGGTFRHRLRVAALFLAATCALPGRGLATETACGTKLAFGADVLADGDMTRSLDCEAYAASLRAMQLCCSLERDLTWSWWGHAIVSPGWRIDWDGVRDVYCRAHVGIGDMDALKTLSQGRKSQLQNGAEFLLRLLRGDDDPASIFNPQNPQYILRRGCD